MIENYVECIIVLLFLSAFPILFAAFIQFLSRACPLPFLQIPSPIHSQKLVHNQEEEEDQSQATPPSGTHVQMYVPRPFVHLLRDGLQMCTTWTYVNVCADSREKSFSWIPGQSFAVTCIYQTLLLRFGPIWTLPQASL